MSEKMRTYEYPFRLTPAEDGGWVISCRDLPEAISQAAADEACTEVAAGCLQAALEGYLRYGMTLPAPSPTQAGEVLIAPPLETLAKVALYSAMEETKVSKSELARRLGVDEKEVRRMLDPGHGSKIPRIAQAVEALGRRLQLTLA